jgi:UDP-N-acetylmuramate dehydrogenase
MRKPSKGNWWKIGDVNVIADGGANTTGRLARALEVALGPGAVGVNESLARYTAFRIGGSAELLVFAKSTKALRQVVVLASKHQVPCRVLGGGSNILVSDAGVCGLVVLNRARAVTFSLPSEPAVQRGGASVQAESGASLSTVARMCVRRGLAGLEWAASIPGSVGGAVVGNAGAWGSDVSSTLVEATVLETGGDSVQWPVEWFEYGYRTSILKHGALRGAPQAVVLQASFALQPGDRQALEAQVAEFATRRKASQPPGATCGSVFRNPPGDYAGRLIEAAGLKGRRAGGAEISTVHANFFVNHGEATATDVKTLIDLARQEVKAQFGVDLQLEIELVGVW